MDEFIGETCTVRLLEAQDQAGDGRGVELLRTEGLLDGNMYAIAVTLQSVVMP